MGVVVVVVRGGWMRDLLWWMGWGFDQSCFLLLFVSRLLRAGGAQFIATGKVEHLGVISIENGNIRRIKRTERKRVQKGKES